MEDIHREAIRRNFSSLVYQTDFDTMHEALIEKGLFTHHMIEQYSSSNLPIIEQKRNMYSAIMRRGPQAFNILLETLEENGHWELVRMLDPSSPLNAASNASSQHSNISENKNFVSLTISRKESNKPKETNELPIKNVLPIENIIEPVVPFTPENHEVPFEVIKSKSFIEDNEINDIKLYKTRSRHRGVCIMFIYINYLNKLEEQRKGAEKDRNNLVHLFSEIGFIVRPYQDLTYQETINTLVQLKQVLGPELESVFVFVSSHGYERRGSSDTDIRCHDGLLLSLQDIIAYFSNKEMPHLQDVPKVFIFQNCRGTNENYILDGDTAPPHLTLPVSVETDGMASNAPASLTVKATSLYTNILVVQSTLPGFVSYRHTEKGSWYVQVLCEKFAERAHDTHVDDLFTMVDQLLKQRYRIQTSSVDRWGFNKRLYLHPGLFE